MSKSENHSLQPKSIRQKKILDIAAEKPSASLDEIAERVPSATADHVDRVLNQYGDPGASSDESTGDSETEDWDDAPNSNSMPDSNSADGGTAPTDQTDESAVPDGAAESTATEQNDAPAATGQDDEGEAPERTEQADAPAATEPPVETESTGSVADGETEASTPMETGTTDTDELGPTTAEETSPDPEDLTQKERETLRAICYEPDATQKQIADMLSVSRATVSNRVNAIQGFNWADRQAFVDDVFEGDLVVNEWGDSGATAAKNGSGNAGKEVLTDGASGTVSGESSGVPNPDAKPDTAGVTKTGSNASPPKGHNPSGTEPSGGSISREIERVSERLATIEQEVSTEDGSDGDDPFDDSELVHKIVYVCMNSERVSEEEELQILEGLME